MRKPKPARDYKVPLMAQRGGKGVHGKKGYVRDKAIYEEETKEEKLRDRDWELDYYDIYYPTGADLIDDIMDAWDSYD